MQLVYHYQDGTVEHTTGSTSDPFYQRAIEKGAETYRRRVADEPSYYGRIDIVFPGASHAAAWNFVMRRG